MKKIVVALLAALTLALAIVPTAFAETDCENRICKLAQADERVKQARCVVYERTAVVAVKTEKFSAASQYDEYVRQLSEAIKSECEVDHVFVTRNPKIMKEINELSKLDENERDQAIQKIIEGVMRLRPPRKLDLTKVTSGK